MGDREMKIKYFLITYPDHYELELDGVVGRELIRTTTTRDEMDIIIAEMKAGKRNHRAERAALAEEELTLDLR